MSDQPRFLRLRRLICALVGHRWVIFTDYGVGEAFDMCERCWKCNP